MPPHRPSCISDLTAKAIIPITPSSEVGEIVSKAVADGQKRFQLRRGHQRAGRHRHLHRHGAGRRPRAGCHLRAGPAAESGRAALHLRPRACRWCSTSPAARSTRRSISRTATPTSPRRWAIGWLIFMAPNVQAVYDMNIIAIKVAEAVGLPAIVAYDGFHTSHANRRIEIFADPGGCRAPSWATSRSAPQRARSRAPDHLRSVHER